MPKPRNAKEKILDCAEELVTKIGAANMTLDAIAERAGLSKGGLLYHFSTKDALLRAMVTRLLERFERLQEQVRGNLPDTPNRDLKAYVIASLEMNGVLHRFHIKKNVCTALLAAIANDPKLVTPIREYHRRRVNALARTALGFEKSAVIFFAAEGLTLHELLQVSPLSKKQRDQFIRFLLSMIDETN